MQPTAEEIRDQLERLIASEGFSNADRMSSFLRYVVDRTLVGESNQIKEYVIGVEVFGRDEHYDPRLDSIVRVEARRLRTKIDEYYAGPGSNDPVIIRMNRGGYVPAFERRPPPEPVTALSVTQQPDVNGRIVATLPSPAHPAREPVQTYRGVRIAVGLFAATVLLVSLAAWRSGLWEASSQASGVAIAVLPFAQYSTDASDQLLAARLTDGVTAELARLHTVGVISRTSAQQSGLAGKPVDEIARILHANMIMEGTVLRDGALVRVNARVVDPRLDRKVWGDALTAPATELPELERRIAKAVSTAAIAAARATPAR